MTVTYNLLTDEEHFYMEGTCPLKALKSSYAISNNLASRLATGGIEAIKASVIEGKHCLFCGNWAVIK